MRHLHRSKERLTKCASGGHQKSEPARSAQPGPYKTPVQPSSCCPRRVHFSSVLNSAELPISIGSSTAESDSSEADVHDSNSGKDYSPRPRRRQQCVDLHVTARWIGGGLDQVLVTYSLKSLIDLLKSLIDLLSISCSSVVCFLLVFEGCSNVAQRLL